MNRYHAHTSRDDYSCGILPVVRSGVCGFASDGLANVQWRMALAKRRSTQKAPQEGVCTLTIRKPMEMNELATYEGQHPTKDVCALTILTLAVV
jgi:hypothetical protein